LFGYKDRITSTEEKRKGTHIKKGPIDMGPVPKLTAYEKTDCILIIRLLSIKKGSLLIVNIF
jgi:hypothetical protein